MLRSIAAIAQAAGEDQSSPVPTSRTRAEADCAGCGPISSSAYGSRGLRVACRVPTKSSWRSAIAAVSPFANSAVTLSRNANRSSKAFRLLASGVWFATSRTRLKKRLDVSAPRPKFFWFA